MGRARAAGLSAGIYKTAAVARRILPPPKTYDRKGATPMATARKVDPIPEGWHTAIPSLVVHDATAALAFYGQAFGAVETLRLPYPDGRIGHAELRIGAATVMLADEHPDRGYLSPRSLGGSPVSLMLYVEDADAWFARAVTAGATVKCELRNEFYGDRSAQVVDPFGHVWTLSTRIEDLDATEVVRRFEALLASSPGTATEEAT
jgi:PhnB protein